LVRIQVPYYTNVDLKYYCILTLLTHFFSVFSAGSFSHEKPLLVDPLDRAHTTSRMMTFALLLSTTIQFCFPGAPLQTLLPTNPVLQAIASVFAHPSLQDFVKVGFCIYPALTQLNVLVTSMRKDAMLSVGNVEWDFAISAFILVILIGSFCNMVTFRITGRFVVGLDTTVGACLGYYQRATTFRRLITVFEQPVTAATAFWTHLALMVFTTNNSDWFPAALAWILAGWAGSAFAQYHLESQALVGGLFQFFGGLI
jgi:hypothetical protein